MKNKKVMILLIVIIALIIIGFVIFGATGLGQDIKSIKDSNNPKIAEYDHNLNRYVGNGYSLKFQGGYGDTEWFLYLGNTNIKICSFCYRHPMSGDQNVLF